eukprot:sb/3462249/
MGQSPQDGELMPCYTCQSIGLTRFSRENCGQSIGLTVLHCLSLFHFELLVLPSCPRPPLHVLIMSIILLCLETYCVCQHSTISPTNSQNFKFLALKLWFWQQLNFMRVAIILFFCSVLLTVQGSEQRLTDLARLSKTVESILDRLELLEIRMANLNMGPIESKVVSKERVQTANARIPFLRTPVPGCPSNSRRAYVDQGQISCPEGYFLSRVGLVRDTITLLGDCCPKNNKKKQLRNSRQYSDYNNNILCAMLVSQKTASLDFFSSPISVARLPKETTSGRGPFSFLSPIRFIELTFGASFNSANKPSTLSLVEDEEHLLFTCLQYITPRIKMIDDLRKHSLSIPNSTEDLIPTLNHPIAANILAQYVNTCLTLRGQGDSMHQPKSTCPDSLRSSGDILEDFLIRDPIPPADAERHSKHPTITAVQSFLQSFLQLSSHCETLSLNSNCIADMELTEQTDIRKRKRADYSKLSPEERTLKRKLKNRMSAQQARDRKKVFVSELEGRIAQLEKENENLRRICSMQLGGTGDSAAIPALQWALLVLQLLVRASRGTSSPVESGVPAQEPRQTVPSRCRLERPTWRYSNPQLDLQPGQPPPALPPEVDTPKPIPSTPVLTTPPTPILATPHTQILASPPPVIASPPTPVLTIPQTPLLATTPVGPSSPVLSTVDSTLTSPNYTAPVEDLQWSDFLAPSPGAVSSPDSGVDLSDSDFLSDTDAFSELIDGPLFEGNLMDTVPGPGPQGTVARSEFNGPGPWCKLNISMESLITFNVTYSARYHLNVSDST